MFEPKNIFFFFIPHIPTEKSRLLKKNLVGICFFLFSTKLKCMLKISKSHNIRCHRRNVILQAIFQFHNADLSRCALALPCIRVWYNVEKHFYRNCLESDQKSTTHKFAVGRRMFVNMVLFACVTKQIISLHAIVWHKLIFGHQTKLFYKNVEESSFFLLLLLLLIHKLIPNWMNKHRKSEGTTKYFWFV